MNSLLFKNNVLLILMSVRKRHPIRNSEIREIVEDLETRLNEGVEDLFEGRVETAELESGENIILIDRKPAFLMRGDEYFPLLFFADRLPLRKVTVDMGAVKPISDGADVMAPGVIGYDEQIKSGDVVGIEDEKNHELIAIGAALKRGASLKGEKGRVIENIHHVGDKFWDLKEEF